MPAKKRFPDGPLGPASSAFTVTPHDSNELPSIPRKLFVGGAGNITLRLADDTTDVVLNGVAAGQVLDIQPRFIRLTGTTASNLVALT